jgi:hypothetical protein
LMYTFDGPSEMRRGVEETTCGEAVVDCHDGVWSARSLYAVSTSHNVRSVTREVLSVDGDHLHQVSIG